MLLPISLSRRQKTQRRRYLALDRDHKGPFGYYKPAEDGPDVCFLPRPRLHLPDIRPGAPTLFDSATPLIPGWGIGRFTPLRFGF